MVGKLHFVSTVTTILILDLLCNSQRDHEIPSIKKIPHMFDVTRNNFRCTVGDLVVSFCTNSIPKRLRKGGAVSQTIRKL